MTAGTASAVSVPSHDADIRGAVEQYLRQKTAGLDFVAQIKRLTIHGKTVPAEGTFDYEVVAPPQWEGWGKVNLAVVIRKGDRIVSNVPVTVDVEALAEMVVALHQIDQGTIISHGDLALRKEDISAVRGKYIKTVEGAAGYKARQTIRANTPLKPEQLVKVPLIHSGQLVTVIAEQGSLRVTVTGKAKNAGALGDTVMVQNLNSLKEFPAKVISATTVQVLF